MADTPNLSLPYIEAAQAQKHVTHNEAIRALDALVQLAVLDRDLAGPPASPADGDRYIVAASPTGAWSGQAGRVAAWQDGAWAFYAPREGFTAWVADEDRLCAWDGAGWVVAGGTVNPVALVGVNATADTTNRLSVASSGSLFNHAGAGHQLKVNKAAVGDTGSVLFQTGFSGRAEMGLAGSDEFSFKTSADGAAWTTPLTFVGALALAKLTPIEVPLVAATQTQPAFKMTGMSRAGVNDTGKGVGLYLTYNATGNRQFMLADTETLTGVRFINASIDGFNMGTSARSQIAIGTAGVGGGFGNLLGGRLTVSNNHQGTVTNVVHEIQGAVGQTGDLLRITDVFGGTTGGVLMVKAAGNVGIGQTAPSTKLHVAGPIRPETYTVAGAPSAATAGAGAMIYVSNGNAGAACLAVSDGSAWKRIALGATISVT